MIGALQAMEAIKILTGHGETLAGRMLHYDATNARMREISLKADPECSLCGNTPSITSPGISSKSSMETARLKEISANDALALIGEGYEGILLDVREASEHASAHLEGCRLAPLSQISKHLEELPRDVPYLVYCKVGQRSAHAGTLMLDSGFKDVTNLSGGIMDWIRVGGPLIQP
ncbi:MAG: hypothetical protein CMN06_08060 [Roseibacillus sp.]|nr:hypothetical protein [Roseibacillus sp.]